MSLSCSIRHSPKSYSHKNPIVHVHLCCSMTPVTSKHLSHFTWININSTHAQVLQRIRFPDCMSLGCKKSKYILNRGQHVRWLIFLHVVCIHNPYKTLVFFLESLSQVTAFFRCSCVHATNSTHQFVIYHRHPVQGLGPLLFVVVYNLKLVLFYWLVSGCIYQYSFHLFT
jgi:hypothetical protein